MLFVNRYMGFRKPEDVSKESDYTFQISHAGKWTFHSLIDNKKVQGEISKNWNEIRTAIADFPFPIEKPDDPELVIPDMPQFTVELTSDDAQAKRYSFSPQDDEAKLLHAAIIDWRDGKNAIPHQIIQRVEFHERRDLGHRASFGEPVVVMSSTELATHVDSDDLVKSITERIDFESQKLLIFFWSGSGQDQIDYELNLSENKIAFFRMPGMTRDLRNHVRVFAVEKSSKIEVRQER